MFCLGDKPSLHIELRKHSIFKRRHIGPFEYITTLPSSKFEYSNNMRRASLDEKNQIENVDFYYNYHLCRYIIFYEYDGNSAIVKSMTVEVYLPLPLPSDYDDRLASYEQIYSDQILPLIA
uniref:Uncharacterized protein n=1 Tax=Angiostrongylus cantonensis TaxID=6313 RepID=A0A0K0DEM2_ANGCA